MIPSYCKILTLGSAYTDSALVGDVVVQEKVDGSAIKFGLTDQKELIIGSRNTILGHADENKMFKEGYEHIMSIADKIKRFPPCTYFYGEYLQKNRHNAIKYDRIPLNHIVLFDVVSEGRYFDRQKLAETALELTIDVVPEVYRGRIEDRGFLAGLIANTQSYLGGSLVEGVVIKNYGQTILLGGQVYPLFTKLVRPEFKEVANQRQKEFKPRLTLEDYFQSFCTEARWLKAIQKMKDNGTWLKDPKDIGSLIKIVQEDIVTEESENIRQHFYTTFIPEILRCSVKGLPQFYKDKLFKGEL